MSYHGHFPRSRFGPYPAGLRGDQRGLARDDPARDTSPYIEPRPNAPAKPEPWFDSRFTHGDPHQRYRGPEVPGPEASRRFAHEYEMPPASPPPFTGRPAAPWPPVSAEPAPAEIFSQPQLPSYDDGLLTREQWDAVIGRQFPRRDGPSVNIPGVVPGSWPEFPDVERSPATPHAALPTESLAAPQELSVPAQFAGEGPQSIPELVPQMTYPTPEPGLGQQMSTPELGMPEPFAPPMPSPYDPSPKFPAFPDPEPFLTFEPYGGLEQRLLEPPIFNGYQPPPMPPF